MIDGFVSVGQQDRRAVDAAGGDVQLAARRDEHGGDRATRADIFLTSAQDGREAVGAAGHVELAEVEDPFARARTRREDVLDAFDLAVQLNGACGDVLDASKQDDDIFGEAADLLRAAQFDVIDPSRAAERDVLDAGDVSVIFVAAGEHVLDAALDDRRAEVKAGVILRAARRYRVVIGRAAGVDGLLAGLQDRRRTVDAARFDIFGAAGGDGATRDEPKVGLNSARRDGIVISCAAP